MTGKDRIAPQPRRQVDRALEPSAASDLDTSEAVLALVSNPGSEAGRAATRDLQARVGNRSVGALLNRRPIGDPEKAGRPLDAALRRELGAALGADLSAVRIHTDSDAARAAASFQAVAVTVGKDIYFGAGAYDPHTQQGTALVAHEVIHTMQSGALQVAALPADPVAVDPTDRLESSSVQRGQAAAFGILAARLAPEELSDTGGRSAGDVSAGPRTATPGGQGNAVAVLRAEQLPLMNRAQQKRLGGIVETLKVHKLTWNQVGFEDPKALTDFLSRGSINTALDRLEAMVDRTAQIQEISLLERARGVVEPTARLAPEVSEGAAIHAIPELPEDTRVPKAVEKGASWTDSRGGQWLGDRGNSEWLSYIPEALVATNSKGVPFRDGHPDFSEWVRETVFIDKITGNDDLDFAAANHELARQKGWLYRGEPNAAEADRFMVKEGLTWHHVEGASQCKLVAVPTAIHANTPHKGSASEAKAIAAKAASVTPASEFAKVAAPSEASVELLKGKSLAAPSEPVAMAGSDTAVTDLAAEPASAVPAKPKSPIVESTANKPVTPVTMAPTPLESRPEMTPSTTKLGAPAQPNPVPGTAGSAKGVSSARTNGGSPLPKTALASGAGNPVVGPAAKVAKPPVLVRTGESSWAAPAQAGGPANLAGGANMAPARAPKKIPPGWSRPASVEREQALDGVAQGQGPAILGGGQLAGQMAHEHIMAVLQGQELDKAAEEIARLQPAVDDLTAQGYWVVKVSVFDEPMIPDFFGKAAGWTEETDIKRFVGAYLRYGRTLEDAYQNLGAPAGPQLYAADPGTASRPTGPLPTRKEGRIWVEVFMGLEPATLGTAGRPLPERSAPDREFSGRWTDLDDKAEPTLEIMATPDRALVSQWWAGGRYNVAGISWDPASRVLRVRFTSAKAPGWVRDSTFLVLSPGGMLESYVSGYPAAGRQGVADSGQRMWTSTTQLPLPDRLR